MEILSLLLICSAAALAGFVDSIVGGGGLILLPALFATFPGAVPASLLGNNKATSVWGTAFASFIYIRRVQLPIKALSVGALLALLGSFLGAWCVTQVDASLFKAALPLLLTALLIYTLLKKEVGQLNAPKFEDNALVLRLAFVGAFIGFYDGFFGPGTGSFFVFVLVRWIGFDFLHASAGAKVLNTASNFAALLLFSLQGLVWWHLALPLAISNVLGSYLGTRIALDKGAGFVRYFFILVVSLLIVKTGYDFVWPLLAK